MIRNVFEIVQLEPYEFLKKKITRIPIPQNFLSLNNVIII
jgi:hypothetical protein